MILNRSIAMASMLMAFGIGAAHAQGLVTTHRLSAPLANEAVGAAVAACLANGYAVTAVLVDSDGVREAMLRGDNAGMHTLDGARDKAYTAASMKADTGALVERAKSRPPSALMAKLPGLVLTQGAIVLKVGDEVIGALGVSGAPGGDKDEVCARAGFDKIKDRLK